jgi:hypothetical protein
MGGAGRPRRALEPRSRAPPIAPEGGRSGKMSRFGTDRSGLLPIAHCPLPIAYLQPAYQRVDGEPNDDAASPTSVCSTGRPMRPELSPKAAEFLSFTRELLVQCGYNSFSYADARRAGQHHRGQHPSLLPQQGSVGKSGRVPISGGCTGSAVWLEAALQRPRGRASSGRSSGGSRPRRSHRARRTAGVAADLPVLLCVWQVALGLGWLLRQSAQRSSHS